MKKSFIKTSGWVLLTALFVFLFSANLAGLVGIYDYIVISGSMEPSIPTGSVAVVDHNVPFDDIQVGDVIIFKCDDMNIIHRVVGETVVNGQKRLSTKGDANEREDDFITTEENYCGKALFHIEKLGYALDFKGWIKK